MGTRGAYGVIAGEVEKIGYGQFDAYPGGRGIEILRWLRGVIDEGKLDELKQQARDCRVVNDKVKPTPEDIEALAFCTNLGVSEQSTDDWYCLTHATHGDLGAMLACGYIEDHSNFPLDSLFCEWAYIVDLDASVFEVYQGFQNALPKKGRWAGRPTAEEDAEDYTAHLARASEQGREPWRPEVSEYKAVELYRSWSLDALPADEEFLAIDREEEEVTA